MTIGIEEFPNRLREAREKAGLSKSELARRIYVNRISIVRWESGEQFPSAAHLPILCEELKVSADWLIGRSDKKKSAQNGGTFKGADEKTSYRNHI